MEETEAIAQLRSGDARGLELLVRRYQVRAVRTAYLVTRDVSLAEDVVQSAFVKAYERIAQLDSSRPFGPWFMRSVLHDAIKAAEKQRRLVSLGNELDDGGAFALADARPGPADLRERAETAEEVREALQQLTPRQRAAIVARYYLDWSEASVAEALGCAPSAVKWRLHAARERLRLLLRSTTME